MRFLKAHKLFNGSSYLPEDSVVVLDNQNLLKEIVKASDVEKSEVESLDGIITPGFINAHCHLELSHLKGKIPEHTGLPAFARQVVALRNGVSKEEISERMQQANVDMYNNGIVAVGDISNTEDSFQEKINSKIYYHTFIELIGLNPANSSIIFEKGLDLLKKLNSLHLPGSLAPHAPYSTSVELIKLIADHSFEKKLSLSIHNQESGEETKFFNGTPSAFEELYRSLGLDISWFKAPNTSSLVHYMQALSESPAILVHNTFTKEAEIRASSHKNIFWCFCPGANSYIENTLPDFTLFSGHKKRICLGTDSLASNSQLDVIAEANRILSQSKVFSPEDLLTAITSNGAEALGISADYGNFIVGKNTGLNLVECRDSKLNFIKKIA